MKYPVEKVPVKGDVLAYGRYDWLCLENNNGSKFMIIKIHARRINPRFNLGYISTGTNKLTSTFTIIDNYKNLKTAITLFGSN